MATLGRHQHQHPPPRPILNASPSFEEEEEEDYSFSQSSMTSLQSSMTGSFKDDYSAGDLSPESFRKPLNPYYGNVVKNMNNKNPTVSFHNSLSTLGLVGAASSNNNKSRSSLPFALHSPGTKAKKKADIDRAKRTIERLNQAEIQLKMREGNNNNNIASKNGGKNKRKSENADIKLKLSQIDIARNFYQRRINQNFVAGPVPMEILNIVKSVSAPPQLPTSSREVV